MNEALAMCFAVAGLLLKIGENPVQTLDQLSGYLQEATGGLTLYPGKILAGQQQDSYKEHLRSMLRESWFQGEALEILLPPLRFGINECQQYFKEKLRFQLLIRARSVVILTVVLLVRVLITHLIRGHSAETKTLDSFLLFAGSLWLPASFHIFFQSYPCHWLWKKGLTKEGITWIRAGLQLSKLPDNSELSRQLTNLKKKSLLCGHDSRTDQKNSLKILTMELKSRQNHQLKKWEENLPLWELFNWTIFILCTLSIPVWQSLSLLTPVDMT